MSVSCHTLAQYNSKQNSICQRKIVAITPTPTDDEKNIAVPAQVMIICLRLRFSLMGKLVSA